jgi:hypothetical protein
MKDIKPWKSTFYPVKVSKKWVSSLWSNYPRATDFLLDFCGKSIKDLWDLASRTQIGWHLFKMAVKAINKAERTKLSTLLRNSEDYYKNSVGTTIQMLSSLLADAIFITLDEHYDERLYLTNWFKRVIKVEQGPDFPKNLQL